MDESTTVVTTLVADENSNHKQPEQKQRIILHVTQEKMQGIKWGVIRKAESSPTAQTQFLARFLVDTNGAPLDEKTAFALLDDLTIAEINETWVRLQKAMSEAAAPKA